MIQRSALLLALLLPFHASAATDSAARDLADLMIAAHGGIEKWNSASTLSFRHLSGNREPASEMLAVVEQGSRRTYMEWPAKKSMIVGDGSTVWSVNNDEKTPARFMVNLHYYFLGLPFFTRDPGVRLEMAGEGTLPGEKVVARKLRMTYDPGVGESSDVYVMYIDPSTNLLRGIEYSVTHPAVVPAGKASLEPYFRIYESYENVDGIQIATTMRSVDPSGETRSTSLFDQLSMKLPFDESKMRMPENGVVAKR